MGFERMAVLRLRFLAVRLSALIFMLALPAEVLAGGEVSVANFGMRPYTYRNCTVQLRRAIEHCRATGASVLRIPAGRYGIWPEGAERREWYIGNTSSEAECPSPRATDFRHSSTVMRWPLSLTVTSRCPSTAKSVSSTIRSVRSAIRFFRPSVPRTCSSGATAWSHRYPSGAESCSSSMPAQGW